MTDSPETRPEHAPLPDQRAAFEIPDDEAYLNCAYMSPNLIAVRQAGEAAVAAKSAPWAVTSADFFTNAERARALVARLVGGDADGVAIIPSASYGVALAAANLPVTAGQEIVVLAEQFPSNVYSWWEAARRAEARVRTVPRPAEGPWTPALLDALSSDTAIVAVPHCHWTDGTLVDLDTVGAAVREVGAALVVDATQSLGALPLDVGAVRPDFLIAAAYKWLLGPYSLGFLWAAPHRRDGVPLEQNWITRRGSDNFAGLVDYRDDYAPEARRYDMGERSNFVLLPMGIAALEQLLDWSVPRIAATIARRTGTIEEATRAMGLDPVPACSRAGHMLGVGLPGGMPTDLPERLAAAHVHVSVRGASVRISPHVWVTDRDIDQLLDVLAQTT